MKLKRFGLHGAPFFALMLGFQCLPLKAQDEAIDAYNNGVAADSKGDFDVAIADLSHAIEIHPDYPYAYNYRGMAKRHKGDFDGAIADFSQAIALNPQFANAYYNRGLAKSKKGDFDGAIADYNQAITLNPQYVGATRWGGKAPTPFGSPKRSRNPINCDG